MMTRALFLVMLLLLLAIPGARMRAQTLAGDLSSANDGPLNFHVRADFAYESFDECLRKLEKTTGLPVTCAKDIEALVRAEWADGETPWIHQPTLTRYPTPVTDYLNAVSDDLRLAWKYQPPSRRILLDVAWRREDLRPAKELLEFVAHHGQDNDLEKDVPWQDAFHALLCQSANFSKAVEVRQKAISESFLFGFGGRPWLPPMKVALRAPVVDVDGHRYLLVLAVQDMDFSPGHGCAHYYWFQEDGSLAGAGIMNTGHRISVSGAKIDPASATPPGQTSGILLSVQFNEQGSITARFVLGHDGLQLVNLTDADGKELKNDFQIGGSLLAPEPPLGNGPSHTDKGSYTIQLPAEVEASTVTVMSYLSRPMTAGDFGLRELNWRTKVSGHVCTMATHGATRLKAVVVATGYQTALIDQSALKPDSAQAAAPELKHLAAIPFTGHIDFPEGAEPAQYQLPVDYYGDWIVPYLIPFGGFGLPHVAARSIDVAADGSFTGTVPDLWHDAVVGAHLQGSAFTVMLQDKRTGRVPYELKVEGTVGSDVTIREHYDALKLHAVAWTPTVR